MIVCKLPENFINKFYQYCYTENSYVDCGSCPLDRHLCKYIPCMEYIRKQTYKSNIYARIIKSMTTYK